jgi:hypothetical protein
MRTVLSADQVVGYIGYREQLCRASRRGHRRAYLPARLARRSAGATARSIATSSAPARTTSPGGHQSIASGERIGFDPVAACGRTTALVG